MVLQHLNDMQFPKLHDIEHDDASIDENGSFLNLDEMVFEAVHQVCDRSLLLFFLFAGTITCPGLVVCPSNSSSAYTCIAISCTLHLFS